MVERALPFGTPRASPALMVSERPRSGSSERGAWIVEDEPAAATLAVELCEANGVAVSLFRMPLPFLTALRTGHRPAIVILDWRLEHELSAGLFLATRHRYPSLPVIYWTGSLVSSLPGMIQDDGWTVIVDKASGVAAFELALVWALSGARKPALEGHPTG